MNRLIVFFRRGFFYAFELIDKIYLQVMIWREFYAGDQVTQVGRTH